MTVTKFIRREGLTILHIFVVLAFSMTARHADAADLEISIPIQLTHTQNLDPSPSPDGKKLVFISVISGKEQLFTIDSDGKNISQLTRDDADHEDPAWSPDGKKIAFVRSFNNDVDGEIYTVNVDGTGLKQVTHAPGANSPDWGTHRPVR